MHSYRRIFLVEPGLLRVCGGGGCIWLPKKAVPSSLSQTLDRQECRGRRSPIWVIDYESFKSFPHLSIDARNAKVWDRSLSCTTQEEICNTNFWKGIVLSLCSHRSVDNPGAKAFFMEG